MISDSMKWSAQLTVEKFDEGQVRAATETLGREPSGDDFARLGIAPADVVTVARNLLTTAGIARIYSLILGAGGQAATNTASRIGVGDGTGDAAVGDVDLDADAGSTHRYFMTMDATYPQVVNGAMDFKASFASADGNFAWNEWTIDVGTPTVAAGTTVGALMLNHKTGVAGGTKASGQVWVATAHITLA